MRVLMVNKFLERRGGVETYVFALDQMLRAAGHDVQHFGMDTPGRELGNEWGIYAPAIELGGGQGTSRAKDVARTIDARENARLMTRLLDAFEPDVVHLNNIHYHLTPSVIEAADEWRRGRGGRAALVMTMHDYHSVVPCDGCMSNSSYEVCDRCLDGRYARCVLRTCTRGGRAKSLVAAMEAAHWRRRRAYQRLDLSICPSLCMQAKFERTPAFRRRTVHLPNFTSAARAMEVPEKGGYVLYFGAYNRDKGVGTLLDVAERHPEIPFVFCGRGGYAGRMASLPNVTDRGFQTGDALREIVGRATLTAAPSEWLENSPFAVLEALGAGTPVLGADAGGIPELIEPGVTGELFEFRNPADLEEKLVSLWADRPRLARYAKNCLSFSPMTPGRYLQEITRIYEDPAAALAQKEPA
ncbi:MAG: glycosyltransferase family 4 protein [Coriobacteriia bacterium]